MEWWAVLMTFFGALAVLLMLKVPVAFALLSVNAAGAIYFFGIENAARQVVLGGFGSLSTFVLVPVPLFILMGELLFRSQVANRAVDVMDHLLGRVPARLGLLTTGTGTMFGLLSGSTLANTALLGSTMLPRMLESGYSSRFAMGSVLASGGLAMIIPPSALAVLWGATAGVPIGPLLIAGLVPGLLMAAMYVLVQTVWARRPNVAPAGKDGPPDSHARSRGVLLEVVPLALIFVLVVGAIFAGIATATESAAGGVLGSLALCGAKRVLTMRLVMDSLIGAAKLTGMLFFILMASKVYSQLMAFSGATSGAVTWLLSLSVPPLGVLMLMLFAILILGFFLDQVSIMLVTLPFFMPVVTGMGWDPLWFGIIMLIGLQVAFTTPPFGLSLFVMKGLAPEGTKLTDIYAAAVPFVASDLLVIVMLVVAPSLVTVLPALMAA